MTDNNEINRIRDVYEKRAGSIPAQRYSCFSPETLFIEQQLDRVLIETLKRSPLSCLKNAKILDIGCGSGGELRNIIRYGAEPANLFGIDLIQNRIESAKKLSPNIDFRCGSAENLPYADGMFDVVMQFTVFTSIIDRSMKQRIAKEMLRVLHESGIIIWYDFHMNNPKNPDVRGVNKREIRELFPGCDIHLKRVTLAPPLARAIAPYSWLACYLLERLPFLRTHYLGIIKKRSQ